MMPLEPSGFLTLENAINRDNLIVELTDHSYTLSFVWPVKMIFPMWKPFIRKKIDKNSIELLLVWKNWEIEIRFYHVGNIKDIILSKGDSMRG